MTNVNSALFLTRESEITTPSYSYIDPQLKYENIMKSITYWKPLRTISDNTSHLENTQLINTWRLLVGYPNVVWFHWRKEGTANICYSATTIYVIHNVEQLQRGVGKCSLTFRAVFSLLRCLDAREHRANKFYPEPSHLLSLILCGRGEKEDLNGIQTTLTFGRVWSVGSLTKCTLRQHVWEK